MWEFIECFFCFWVCVWGGGPLKREINKKGDHKTHTASAMWGAHAGGLR